MNRCKELFNASHSRVLRVPGIALQLVCFTCGFGSFPHEDLTVCDTEVSHGHPRVLLQIHYSIVQVGNEMHTATAGGGDF